jgi:hypothetical protein
MTKSKEFFARYSSSSNLESAAEFINIPANKGRVLKAGVPVIVIGDFRFPFRNKVQRQEIREFGKIITSELNKITEIIGLSPKVAATKLKESYGFSNNIIKSLV